MSKCKPRKGYLALESEGSECHFRNLKIKELPSTNPKKEEIADVAQGHKQLYTGLDLSGWKADDEAKKHWQPKDWKLHYDGKGKPLATEKEFGDSEFIVDFKFPKKDAKPCEFIFRDEKGKEAKVILAVNGTIAVETSKDATSRMFDTLELPGKWHRLFVTLKGANAEVLLSGPETAGVQFAIAPGKGRFSIKPMGEMDFANLFVRPLKK